MTRPSVLAFLQARMSSRRLPGKVLEPLAGAPALQRQIERVGRADIDGVVVLTSTNVEDDPVADLAAACDVPCFRGSLDDVLDRFVAALEHHPCEHVIRLPGDCPLADWSLIDRVVREHLASGCAYTSNTVQRSFPKGLDIECVQADALRDAAARADDGYEREHVTPFFYRGAGASLGTHHVVDDVDRSALRWTLDWPEDYAFIRAVYDALYPDDDAFGTQDVLELLRRRPELAEINAGRVQSG